MNNTTDLVVIDQQQALAPGNLFGTFDPNEIVAKATETATALAAVIEKQGLFNSIQGRKHVRVEGWTLLGTMLGVFPVLAWTRPIENGWEARVEAKTLGGATVGAAEAQCTRSEGTWRNRDDFAIRSMAQTRATSKCLRIPLGFVVTLAGYDPTPNEEVTDDMRGGARPSQQSTAPRPRGQTIQDEFFTADGVLIICEPGVSKSGKGYWTMTNRRCDTHNQPWFSNDKERWSHKNTDGSFHQWDGTGLDEDEMDRSE